MMYQDYTDKPKHFLLGSYTTFTNFPLENSNLEYYMYIPTIHNIEWRFAVDTTKSGETNNLKFSVFPTNQPNDCFYSVEMDVAVMIENLESSEYSIKAQGSYEFSATKRELVIEIPGYDKITDRNQGFFDDKKDEKTFKIHFNMVVKSINLCDSVRMLDFYKFDESLFDSEVNVWGHTMYLNKKLISLQSPTLAELVETNNIASSDIPSGVSFEDMHDFFQVIHGVDLKLNETNIEAFLKLANHLKVPRITEYCKEQMIVGVSGMTTNQIVDLAEELSFWDVVPRKVAAAKSLADLKAQNWDLEKLDDDVITQITRRIFELN
ncbi:hypothetical protein L5515_013325 [Caenorhabditis briggsae]|uniref:BTB domain-containing protein n=1 Tax=Caenorhabditis briggsae TaxID=6238 RepID=A0AAE9E626_CAEBR|nr:hypothetical protein L5515_013325 [Caenorhabditis briggsae]